jgi:hypothetical protein
MGNEEYLSWSIFYARKAQREQLEIEKARR